jgi:formylglycine-generating enzyme required for sulfatase activity
LSDNPRQIKRTVNVFLMLWALAEKRKGRLQGRIKPVRLAKVVAIQAAHPDLYNLLLKDEPRYLRELEEYYFNDGVYKYQQESNSAGGVNKRPDPAPALVPFLSQRGAAAVRRILVMMGPEIEDADFSGLLPDELKLYFTLTARAEVPQAATAVETARLVFEPQLVKIPAGKFLMGSTKEQAAQAIKDGADRKWVQYEQPQHTVELSEYSIGKYPITNREYQAFVREAKYNPPRGWDGDQFLAEKGSHPVVNVSWNDADAYCKWLGDKTKKNYRLPTEAEWEKAARGEDGRVYSWGDNFDSKKANTSEAKIGDTSDVGQFSPRGDSPYGCADVIGNVWEWCNDWFKEDEYKQRQSSVEKDPSGPKDGQARVLRGGSFDYDLGDARCAGRSRIDPDNSNNVIGFRVASSPIISL